MVPISRLFVISGAFIFVTIVHLANALGFHVEPWLVSPVITALILVVAMTIVIIGMKIGTWILVLILAEIVICLYVYFQYELNIIVIMPDYNILYLIGGIIK